MSESHPHIPIHAANEEALAELAWTLELAVGEFSLHVVRCNYVNLQAQLAQRLQTLCPVDIHLITLTETAQTLYTTLKAQLGDAQPQAVMVLGLEQVDNLDQVFAATELVREEYRKNFQFPLMLWLNDATLIKFRRLAPNFASWAGVTTELAIAPDTLRGVLQQAIDQLFATLLTPNTSQSFNQLLETLDLGFLQRFEIEAAFEDLSTLGVTLDPDFQSDLDFARGFNASNDPEALDYFQKSLTFWDGRSSAVSLDAPLDLSSNSQADTSQASIPSLKHGVVLYYLSRYRYVEAEKNDFQHIDWIAIQQPIQQSLESFDAAQRPDLTAKCTTQYQRVLQKQQDWEQLKHVSERGIELHQTYGTQRRLSQDYGFLARIALEQHEYETAHQHAQQALETLVDPLPDQKWLQGLYLLFLGQSQAKLGNVNGAIASLEKARALGDSGHYKTYLIILEELRSLYQHKKRYLKAFQTKRLRLSIEQQYGLRAFVGAGRLAPGREEALEVQGVQETQVQFEEDDASEDRVAAEIRASGRYTNLEDLLRRTHDNTYKLTVVYGDSGVGKSSLIHAGFVPALKQSHSGVRDNLPVVVRKYTIGWMTELADRLKTAIVDDRDFNRQPLESLRKALELEDQLPERVLEQLRQNEYLNLRTILIFDQFEEFFFANPDVLQRRRFFEFLGNCLQIPFVKVFLSLREDYIHYLLECRQLPSIRQTGIDILSQHVLYELGDFTPNDAKTIIQDLTQRSSAFDLDAELVDAVVHDLAGELGQVRPIELQIVGAQLQTEQITTLDAYQMLGDRPKEELVKRYLAEVIQDCGEENQDDAELILYLLTDERGTRPLKTRPELERELDDLISVEDQKRLRLAVPTTGVPRNKKSKRKTRAPAENGDAAIDILDLILQVLSGSGIVAHLPEIPDDRYQLVHDYLAEFIRRQNEPKLKQLTAELEEERKRREEAESQQKVLEKLVAELEHEKKLRGQAISKQESLKVSNRKIARRLRAASAFLSISVVAAMIASGMVWKTSSDVRVEEAETMEAQEQARESREDLVDALEERNQLEAELETLTERLDQVKAQLAQERQDNN